MGRIIESIPKETMTVLSRYSWPGNIRELQNLMERAVLLSTSPSLRAPLGEILTGSDHSAISRGNALEQAERELILRALRREQLGGRRCSWGGSSPRPQEDVACLQNPKAGDLSPTAVTEVWRSGKRANPPSSNQAPWVPDQRNK